MRCRLLSNLIQSRHLLCSSLNSRKNNALTYAQLRQTKRFSIINQKRYVSTKNEDVGDPHNLAAAVDPKYKVFDDKDADVIFDVTEEMRKINLDELNKPTEERNPYEGLNLERGVRGVFDIEDLVAVLRKDNARNIFVARVPEDYGYVDYMVVVTAKSTRHLLALATLVRKVYKLKRNPNDAVPKLEGEKSKDWIALDLGNIALHILSDAARNLYDLDTLWSVGAEFDDESNKSDDSSLMEQYNTFLKEFKPADAEEASEGERLKT